MKYKVRVYQVGAMGLFTKADGYRDYEFESHLSLAEFARGLSQEGFQDGNKWIMPSAIVWVEQL